LTQFNAHNRAANLTVRESDRVPVGSVDDTAPIPESPHLWLRTRQFQEKNQLFDVIRKKWVADTPEERVRQELLRHLTCHLGYPSGQISIERRALKSSSHRSSIRRILRPSLFGNPMGRYDALLRTPDGRPLLLIECKAPGIALNQAVFDQAAVYNVQLNVPFLLLCNGPDVLMAQLDHTNGRYVFAPEIPHYSSLVALVEHH